MRSFLNHDFSKNIIFHCLTPFFPLSHHGPRASPMSLKLCDLPKKSIIAFICRPHFLEIINDFPDTTLCFTTGSKISNRIGFAYSIGDPTFSYHHRASASILSAELQTNFQCLEHILALPIPPSHIFLIVSDSLSTLTAVVNVHFTNPFVTRIHTMLITLPSTSLTISFVWVLVTEEFQATETSLASILKSSLRKPISHSLFVAK